MTGPLPKLPLDLSDFARLRREGYVYVDKTRQIHEMVTGAIYFFLSRPRRFGKSLTVSTLNYLFRGERELFDGLWIGEQGRWDWTPHPVVLLDFNRVPARNPSELEGALCRRLGAIAEEHGLRLDMPTPSERLGELIHGLTEKHGQRVIVLVDEYDKPMIDHLGAGDDRLQIAIENRDLLKSMFGVLKGADIVDQLRLVFITGVSRFSRVSIFSELNNLNDLSMNRQYADMVGWTGEELQANFAGHVAALAEELGLTEEAAFQRLTELYNGYRFSSKDVLVFNPFCLVRAFYQKELGNFWFRSGSPSFLVRLMKERAFPVLDLEGVSVGGSQFDTFDLSNLNLTALLFQTGYLTVKDCDGFGGFTLGFPNEEVRAGFYEQLLFSGGDDYLPLQETPHALSLARFLAQEDLPAFIETARGLFASLPYQQGTKLQEAHFHALFYMMLALSGMRVHCELLTSQGRIDLAVEFADKVYVIELKCGQPADAALQQIEDCGYLDRYAGTGKKRIAVGIEFDTQQRNIGEWKDRVL